MSYLKDKFGLEWLGPEGAPMELRGPGAPLPNMDDAVAAYTLPLLKQLKASGGTSQIFDLAEKIEARVEVLSTVVQQLLAKGYMEKLQENRIGNDEVKLTTAGESFLQRYARD